MKLALLRLIKSKIMVCLIMFFLFFHSAQMFASEPNPNPFQTLAEEKTVAESYVHILNQFGKKDVDNYAKGIIFYAEASAKFNGLIEMMKNQLIIGESFDATHSFRESMKVAVDHRLLFTDFIDEKIIGDNKGTRGGLKATLTTVTELVSKLTDVAKFIWTEYRSVNDNQRKELLTQLDGMKWKEFSEIAAQ